MGHCSLRCAGCSWGLYSLPIQMAEKQGQRVIQKMRKTLYVFGNEYLEQDSLAHKVAEHLDYPVRHCDTPYVLLEMPDRDMLILDVVKGIAAPMIIRNADQLKTRNMMSLHDFDLGFVLSLL